MRWVAFLLLALSGCASNWEATPVAQRGSLTDTDVLRVPDRYVGLWATPRSACGVTRDYGVQIQITAETFGTARVTRVQGHADYEAIRVTLDRDGSFGAREAYLELSRDQRLLRIGWAGVGREQLLHRCPDQTRR